MTDTIMETSTEQPAAAEPTTDWRASVSEEYRDTQLVKDSSDINSVIKQTLDAQSKLGEAVFLPKDGDEDATDKLNKVYDKLGRPEDATKYAIERPEMPEDLPYDEGLESAFLSASHKAGLNNAQAQAIIAEIVPYMNEAVLGQMTESVEMAEKAKTDTINAMSKELGGEEKLNVFVEESKRGFDALAKDAGISDEAKEAWLARNGNDQTALKLFNKYFEQTKDDSFIGGKEPGNNPEWKPKYSESPNLYTDKQKYPKEHQWFIDQGHKF